MSCIRGDILEYDEFFRRVGESAAAVFRDEYHVFYSDSEKSGQIDAGLRGDKMSGGENLFRAGRYARLLVNLNADSVTRAVAEEFAVARVGYDIARGFVRVGAGDAGSHLLHRGELRFEDGVVYLLLLTEPTATVRVMSLWYPPTTAP